jgi:NAD(P)H-hydrate epimerase
MNRIVTLPRLPDRPIEGHKGLFGRVLVVGGSDSMIGAPVLAGTAALRTGAGLVQLAVPRTFLAAALSITPELIGFPLGGANHAELVRSAQLADAVVVGPGMGVKSDAKARLHRLMRLNLPMVLDADALNLLAFGTKWPAAFKAAAVLTPHPGEMKRLCRLLTGKSPEAQDDDSRIELAGRAARAFGQILVLKGHRTVVTDGKQVYVNRTGDSSLSKAGTGDVLSGIIAALLAQKMDRFHAACAGVWIHGRAGELAGRALGRRCVLARDVIDAIPPTLREYDAAL